MDEEDQKLSDTHSVHDENPKADTAAEESAETSADEGDTELVRSFSSADWRLRPLSDGHLPAEVPGHISRDGLVNKAHRKLRYSSVDRRRHRPKCRGGSLKKAQSCTLMKIQSPEVYRRQTPGEDEEVEDEEEGDEDEEEFESVSESETESSITDDTETDSETVSLSSTPSPAPAPVPVIAPAVARASIAPRVLAPSSVAPGVLTPAPFAHRMFAQAPTAPRMFVPAPIAPRVLVQSPVAPRAPASPQVAVQASAPDIVPAQAQFQDKTKSDEVAPAPVEALAPVSRPALSSAPVSAPRSVTGSDRPSRLMMIRDVFHRKVHLDTRQEYWARLRQNQWRGAISSYFGRHSPQQPLKSDTTLPVVPMSQVRGQRSPVERVGITDKRDELGEISGPTGQCRPSDKSDVDDDPDDGDDDVDDVDDVDDATNRNNSAPIHKTKSSDVDEKDAETESDLIRTTIGDETKTVEGITETTGVDLTNNTPAVLEVPQNKSESDSGATRELTDDAIKEGNTNNSAPNYQSPSEDEEPEGGDKDDGVTDTIYPANLMTEINTFAETVGAAEVDTTKAERMSGDAEVTVNGQGKDKTACPETAYVDSESDDELAPDDDSIQEYLDIKAKFETNSKTIDHHYLTCNDDVNRAWEEHILENDRCLPIECALDRRFAEAVRVLKNWKDEWERQRVEAKSMDISADMLRAQNQNMMAEMTETVLGIMELESRANVPLEDILDEINKLNEMTDELARRNEMRNNTIGELQEYVEKAIVDMVSNDIDIVFTKQVERFDCSTPLPKSIRADNMPYAVEKLNMEVSERLEASTPMPGRIRADHHPCVDVMQKLNMESSERLEESTPMPERIREDQLPRFDVIEKLNVEISERFEESSRADHNPCGDIMEKLHMESPESLTEDTIPWVNVADDDTLQSPSIVNCSKSNETVSFPPEVHTSEIYSENLTIEDAPEIKSAEDPDHNAADPGMESPILEIADIRCPSIMKSPLWEQIDSTPSRVSQDSLPQTPECNSPFTNSPLITVPDYYQTESPMRTDSVHFASLNMTKAKTATMNITSYEAKPLKPSQLPQPSFYLARRTMPYSDTALSDKRKYCLPSDSKLKYRLYQSKSIQHCTIDTLDQSASVLHWLRCCRSRVLTKSQIPTPTYNMPLCTLRYAERETVLPEWPNNLKHCDDYRREAFLPRIRQSKASPHKDDSYITPAEVMTPEFKHKRKTSDEKLMLVSQEQQETNVSFGKKRKKKEINSKINTGIKLSKQSMHSETLHSHRYEMTAGPQCSGTFHQSKEDFTPCQDRKIMIVSKRQDRNVSSGKKKMKEIKSKINTGLCATTRKMLGKNANDELKRHNTALPSINVSEAPCKKPDMASITEESKFLKRMKKNAKSRIDTGLSARNKTPTEDIHSSIASLHLKALKDDDGKITRSDKLPSAKRKLAPINMEKTPKLRTADISILPAIQKAGSLPPIRKCPVSPLNLDGILSARSDLSPLSAIERAPMSPILAGGNLSFRNGMSPSGLSPLPAIGGSTIIARGDLGVRNNMIPLPAIASTKKIGQSVQDKDAGFEYDFLHNDYY